MTRKTNLKQKQKLKTVDFADKLAELSNQLRLMEQKMTMSIDRNIQAEYENHRHELNHSTYAVNKAHLKFQTEQKKLVPSRFTFNKHKKRLS